MLDWLKTHYPIDQRRIYVAGFSNGALFSTRIGIAFSHVFAAVCSFMGGFVFTLQPNNSSIHQEKEENTKILCERKIPFKIITGTKGIRM